MTSGEDWAGKKPFRFSDAVSALRSSFAGQQAGTQASDAKAKGGSIRQVHLVQQTDQSNSVKFDPEVFPDISLEHLRDVLLLEETAQKQVMAAHEEAKLNWDLDARLVGGQRSDSNLGLARVFDLLGHISMIPDGGSSDTNSKSVNGDERTYVDAEGKVVAAQDDEGVAWEGLNTLDAPDKGKASGTQKVFQRQYETHDLLRAIDKKDSQTILMIRDANFDLLLDLNQGGVGASMASGTINTPLGYCIGLGSGWEGTAIVITGALSKFVNNLPDEEDEITESKDGSQARKTKRMRRELDPRTQSRLRKLRTSLKLAIDHSIAIDQTRLLSSYLQVLLMSTGQTFIRETIDSVHQALLTHFSGSQISSTGTIMSSIDPFQVASQAITSFFTESLRTKSQSKDVSQRIASVDDLIANCIGDFILMAIWQDVKLHRKELARLEKDEQRAQTESKAEDDELLIELPTWSFARDDRITTIFSEKIWNLQKLLDLIEWESKGHCSTSATKSSRHPRIWHCATDIVEQFAAVKKRPSSKDRLAALNKIIH
ncbi:hypothetical protein CBS101457_001561 [Exobasidium rhododendri]|nr:hypothetical protein CBS101457_001561 [Exobasidium rhododendri]